jgi:hypothetical protein
MTKSKLMILMAKLKIVRRRGRKKWQLQRLQLLLAV